jgi:hypothetical protein
MLCVPITEPQERMLYALGYGPSMRTTMVEKQLCLGENPKQFYLTLKAIPKQSNELRKLLKLIRKVYQDSK